MTFLGSMQAQTIRIILHSSAHTMIFFGPRDLPMHLHQAIRSFQSRHHSLQSSLLTLVQTYTQLIAPAVEDSALG